MQDKIFVKPKEGITVPDEHTGLPIPADGVEVFKTIYIIRRINDGDLIFDGQVHIVSGEVPAFPQITPKKKG